LDSLRQERLVGVWLETTPTILMQLLLVAAVAGLALEVAAVVVAGLLSYPTSALPEVLI
jgi:hypothetical protein